MLITPKHLITNASMAADVVSPAQQLANVFGYSVQADYATSGSLGGTLSLEASVDHREDDKGNVLNAGNFVTITNSPQVISGAGAFIWNIESSMYPYFRVRYTHAGGDSGTLNVWFFLRGF